MRLTIARKIALTVIAIVILCVGTMAWVTSANLQRGFVDYLNEIQARDLDQFTSLLAQRYRREGDFEWLRRNPGAMRELLGQMTPQLQAEEHPRPQRRRGDGQGRPQREPPPPGARDPLGIGPRLSIVDAGGDALIGPPDVPAGIERAVVVDGARVASVRLRPLRQAGAADTSAAAFLQRQVRDIVLVAGGMVLLATLLAFWLARHLLRPVAGLRDVTARLARGELGARAALVSRDELAELALHVNAMAEALEHSERTRRKMLADVAHELRTPLTVIRGEIEALIDGIRHADAAALASLHAEVLHLNKLVDDLHQLTLADAGDLHFDWRRVDLGALAQPLLARYRTRAADAGLTLTSDIAPALEVGGDPDRLTQLLVNLLENSVRYTDPGGRIAVRLARDAAHAVLTIDDSAPGVPPGEHGAIFERLHRIDAARTRERGGSGLGLAICKALAEAHGGTIAATASPLGGIRIELRIALESA
jgi:two-component system sensor histidine kinase BaeS